MQTIREQAIQMIQRLGKKGYMDVQSLSRRLGFPHDESVQLLNEMGFFRKEHRRFFFKGASQDLPDPQEAEILAHKVLEFFSDQKDKNSNLSDHCLKGGSVLFTSYIFGTRVHDGFWNNLLFFCQLHEYRLVVIPQKFRNPTVAAEAIIQEQFEEDNNDARVIPYLYFDRIFLPGVTVLADVRIQPTAVTPYTGLAPMSEGKSLVVGHATQHLASLPRMLPETPRLVVTTGSVSCLPTIESLAAKRYENDHVLGCVVFSPSAEVSLRHIHANSEGSFYDLNERIERGQAHPAQALYSVWGDSHFGQEDKKAHHWASAYTVMVGAKKIYLNDSFDGSTVNPHVLYPYQKYKFFSTIWKEVQHHNDEVSRLESMGFEVKRIDSNHDDMLSRASKTLRLSETNCMEDAEILFQVFKSGHASVLAGSVVPGGTIDEGFQLLHGHERFNGSRGSKRSYVNISRRTIHNHTHQPSLMRGHIGNGCLCRLDPEYTKGNFTSWAFSITNVYPGHKAQLLVNMTNGDLT